MPSTQPETLSQSRNSQKPVIYAYSRHPLARRTIHSALCSDRQLRGCVRLISDVSLIDPHTLPWVPIIDTCSEENWEQLISRWIAKGGLPIALVSEDKSIREENFKILYLGVRGVVTMSPKLNTQLPAAVHSIIAGKLWISRGTLHEYLRHTSSLFVRLQTRGKFTAREEQIIRFIITGFSNKQIGSVLGISERTVKFHVSNILEKTHAENRGEILELLKAA